MNLSLFTDVLGEFFKNNDFEALKGETEGGFEILAYDSPRFKLDGYVSVTIEGEKNDFLVNLELNRENDKHSPRISSTFLTTMLGGGYFLVKRFRAEDAFMKLEKEFWEYVNKTLPSVRNTAEDQS